MATSSPFRFSDNPTVNLSSLFAVQPQITATFVANVLCPGITLKPTLYVLYRESNSPCPGYQLLGVMVNGEIQTSQLDLDTEYDFKSVWNEDIFTFDRRTVRTEATNYGLSIGLTEAQVVGILNGINDNQAKILIGLYEIMPTQSECTKLTGN